MEVITTRGLIKGIVKAFCENWRLFRYRNPQVILEKLKSLDLETASAEDINNITANTAWTDIVCNVCDRKVDRAIRWDIEMENGMSIFRMSVCQPCLEISLKKCKEATSAQTTKKGKKHA